MHVIHHRINAHAVTDSDTLKICRYRPDTDTDTGIGAALLVDSSLDHLMLQETYKCIGFAL